MNKTDKQQKERRKRKRRRIESIPSKNLPQKGIPSESCCKERHMQYSLRKKSGKGRCVCVWAGNETVKGRRRDWGWDESKWEGRRREKG